jgi:integrase
MKTAKLSKKKVRIKGKDGKKGVFWKVISPKLGGGSTRRFFKEEEAANTYFQQQEAQLANYGAAGASMDERLRGDALAAAEVLKPFGHTLLDAAKHLARHLLTTSGGIPLSEALRLLLKDRERPRYSPVYRKSLEHRLKPFVDSFPEGKTTRQVTPADVESFLDQLHQLNRKAGTLESYRKDIFTLFSFAKERGHCAENPAKRVKKDEIQYRIEILTPEQCARLLAACDAETLPAIAIGMFCGLRSSEISRLDWSKVNLGESVIILDTAVARKTRSRRVVPIPEACKAWITPHSKEAGPVQPKSFRNRRDCVRVRAGFAPSYIKREFEELQGLLKIAKQNKVKLEPWPQNCLRHTAISYALAECGDPGKVSGWAGNSPAMIKQHYDAQATPSAAKAFFAIMPPKRKAKAKAPAKRKPKAKAKEEGKILQFTAAA